MVRWRAPVTDRSPDVLGVFDPRTPAPYFCFPSRVIVVRSPFPNVTKHVVKTESICLLEAGRMGRPAAVVRVPGDSIQRTISRARGAGTCRVLPLFFRWQPPT